MAPMATPLQSSKWGSCVGLWIPCGPTWAILQRGSRGWAGERRPCGEWQTVDKPSSPEARPHKNTHCEPPLCTTGVWQVEHWLCMRRGRGVRKRDPEDGVRLRLLWVCADWLGASCAMVGDCSAQLKVLDRFTSSFLPTPL